MRCLLSVVAFMSVSVGSAMAMFCDGDPVNNVDPLGLVGWGHHKVGQALFRTNPDPTVRAIFNAEEARITSVAYASKNAVTLGLGHGGRSLNGVSPAAYNQAVEELSKELLGTTPAQIRSADKARMLVSEVDAITAGTGPYAAKYAKTIRAYNSGVMTQVRLVDRALAWFAARTVAGGAATGEITGAGRDATRAGGASVRGMAVALGVGLDVAFMAYYKHQLNNLDANDAKEARELGIDVQTLRDARCEVLFHLAAEQAWNQLSEDARRKAVGAVVYMGPGGASLLGVAMVPKVVIANTPEELAQLREKWVDSAAKGIEFIPEPDETGK